VALAETAATRSPARRPISFDAELGALVQWLPVDLWLPALAEDPVALARSLGIDTRGVAPAELLAYKPRRRAVVRLDGHVLKLYADEPDFRAATTALLHGRSLPVTTAVPAGHDMRRRVTAQRVVAGFAVEDPLAVAPAAGDLLRALHGARPTAALRRLHPGVAATATANTIATLVPELAPRLERLLYRIAAETPAPDPVFCHGDFHARQLLHTQTGGLAVLDFDEWGVGSPALDLGTYAAHALDRTPVGGGASTSDRVTEIDAVLEALTTGYGNVPDGLRWHTAVAVLRRAVFPFRTRPTPEWPERVEVMVSTAEVVLPR
jgi:hypothetical protein